MSVNLAGATDRICLKGLSARGRHGVLPMEREEPQLFVVDLAMDLGPEGVRAAGASDQLADSVDYSAVASAVITVIEGPSVNLIETLAARVADVVLGFPRVRSVEVTVHKPEAPLDVAFDDVAVTIIRGDLASQAAAAPAVSTSLAVPAESGSGAAATGAAAAGAGVAAAGVAAAGVAAAPAVVPSFPEEPVASSLEQAPAYEAASEAAPAEPVAVEPASFDADTPAFDAAPAVDAAPAIAPEPVSYDAAAPVLQNQPADEPEVPAFDATVGPLDGVGTAAEAPMDPELAAALAAPAPAPFDVSSFESEPPLDAPNEVEYDVPAMQALEFPGVAASADLRGGGHFGAGLPGDAAHAVAGAAAGATDLGADVLGAAGAAAAGAGAFGAGALGTGAAAAEGMAAAAAGSAAAVPAAAAGAVAGAAGAASGGVDALIADAHAAEAAMAQQFGGAADATSAQGLAAADAADAAAAGGLASTGTPVLGMPAADAAAAGAVAAGAAGAVDAAAAAASMPAAPAPAADPLRTRPAQPAAFVLALGGNVGAVLPNLRKAVAALRDTVGVEITQVAPLARTAAVTDPGSGPQPDYLNTVVLGMTVLSPMELLEVARGLEADAGRVRTQVHGPRTLDVDIVDYADVVSTDAELTIPHPRATQRAFVLAPWAEVDDLAEIGGQSVAMLAENAPDRDGVRWLALDWEESDSLPALPTGQYVAPPLVADEVLSSASASEPPVAPAPAPLPEDEVAVHAAVMAAEAGQAQIGQVPVAGTPIASAPEVAAASAEGAEEDGWGSPVAWKDVLGGNQGVE